MLLIFSKILRIQIKRGQVPLAVKNARVKKTADREK